MIILKEGIQTLEMGTKKGDLDSIKEWAKDTALPGIFYHYSPNREKIMQQGFRLSHHSEYDGIYFAFDEKISAGFGEGSKPIKVMINVSKRELFSGGYGPTPEQEEAINEWEEENPEAAENLGQPGTVSDFMSWCGFKVWDDGIQLIVASPKVIGIIED